MTQEHRKRIESLFHAVLALPEEERASYLAEACPEEPFVREEVSILLSDHAKAAEFFGKLDFAAPLRSAMGLLELPKGSRIGRYEVIRLLGRGGMGEVYLALDPELERKVAIKVLPLTFSSSDELIGRLKKEARAASALNHPNILTIYEFGVDEGVHYIVSEYIEGNSLRSLIGKLSEGDALNYARQTARALAAAHAAGIVHRDIKPENIMVRNDGLVKVLDFGLAKPLPLGPLQSNIDRDTSATTPGMLLGTISYMSPEQVKGQEVDEKTDIWSWGVLLYEMSTGRRPFLGESGSEIMAAILEAEPRMPEDRRLRKVLSFTLEKERWKRCASMTVALEELEEIDVRKRRREHAWRRTPAMVGSLLLFLACIAIIAWYLRTRPIRIERTTRLTNSGNIICAGFAPNGEYVVYATQVGNQESLHVIQLRTNTDSEILPPAPVTYTGIALTRDGFIYYVQRINQFGRLYRRSLLGTMSELIAEDLDSSVAFSPDEKRFIFLRDNTERQETNLVVRNTEDGGEKNVFRLKWRETFYNNPIWTPDGRSIVVAASVNNSATGIPKVGLLSIDVATGKREEMLTGPWYSMMKPVWMRGGSELAISAYMMSSIRRQLIELAWPRGRQSRITDDSADYGDLEANEDSSQLITVQSDRQASIWIVPLKTDAAPEDVTMGGRYYGAAWFGRDRLISELENNGRPASWIINLKTKAQAKLTEGAFVDQDAVASPNLRFIVYSSNRDQIFHLWRLDLEHNSAARLTTRPAQETAPSFTPDGKWIIYTALEADTYSLWRVPVDGGAALEVSDHPAKNGFVSPDGRWILCAYSQNLSDWKTAILDANTGQVVKLLADVPVNEKIPARWSADGNDILYAVTNQNGATNIWERPLNGGFPRQISHFIDGQIFAFAPSPGGDVLACIRGRKSQDLVLMQISK